MRKNVKQDIVNATIELIKQRGSNTDSITIRDICNATGVGTGLINYHFQTKDNLIACCVQQIIGNVIGKFNDMYKQLSDKSPLDKLRTMAKSTCTFLVNNENISRISIMTDLRKSKATDNTSQTLAVYLPLVRDVCPSNVDLLEVKSITYFFIFSLQGLFLRSETIKADLGLDFRNKEDRDKLVDRVIDSVLGKYII